MERMVKPSSNRREYPINGGYGRYKGVRMRKWGRWVAEVRLPNSRDRVWLGSYDTPEKAARAYDAAVFIIRGPCADFNFGPPSGVGEGQQLTPSEIQAMASRYAHQLERMENNNTQTTTTTSHQNSSNTSSWFLPHQSNSDDVLFNGFLEEEENTLSFYQSPRPGISKFPSLFLMSRVASST